MGEIGSQMNNYIKDKQNENTQGRIPFWPTLDKKKGESAIPDARINYVTGGEKNRKEGQRRKRERGKEINLSSLMGSI